MPTKVKPDKKQDTEYISYVQGRMFITHPTTKKKGSTTEWAKILGMTYASFMQRFYAWGAKTPDEVLRLLTQPASKKFTGRASQNNDTFQTSTTFSNSFYSLMKKGCEDIGVLHITDFVKQAIDSYAFNQQEIDSFDFDSMRDPHGHRKEGKQIAIKLNQEQYKVLEAVRNSKRIPFIRSHIGRKERSLLVGEAILIIVSQFLERVEEKKRKSAIA